jgi:hypothetical protein
MVAAEHQGACPIKRFCNGKKAVVFMRGDRQSSKHPCKDRKQNPPERRTIGRV